VIILSKIKFYPPPPFSQTPLILQEELRDTAAAVSLPRYYFDGGPNSALRSFTDFYFDYCI
jgi:hypothetical protein